MHNRVQLFYIYFSYLKVKANNYMKHKTVYLINML